MERFTMTIPGDMQYIQTAKLAVGSVASIGGFDMDAMEDIRVAVGEACKCITCHNQAFWSENYELTAILDEDALTVIIVDGDTEHHVPKGNRICLDCPQEGDLAMDIIRSVMDDMKLDKDGQGKVTITMRKELASAG